MRPVARNSFGDAGRRARARRADAGGPAEAAAVLVDRIRSGSGPHEHSLLLAAALGQPVARLIVPHVPSPYGPMYTLNGMNLLGAEAWGKVLVASGGLQPALEVLSPTLRLRLALAAYHLPLGLYRKNVGSGLASLSVWTQALGRVVEGGLPVDEFGIEYANPFAIVDYVEALFGGSLHFDPHYYETSLVAQAYAAASDERFGSGDEEGDGHPDLVWATYAAAGHLAEAVRHHLTWKQADVGGEEEARVARAVGASVSNVLRSCCLAVRRGWGGPGAEVGVDMNDRVEGGWFRLHEHLVRGGFAETLIL